MWLPPKGKEQPLIVSLHSWSSTYEQHYGIPYAQWAATNGWALIHPDFRGVNNRPQAMGSAFAVQDVIDAVDFAAREAGIDPMQILGDKTKPPLIFRLLDELARVLVVALR